MTFSVDDRKKYMREYYHNNKYKWINYYHSHVLPKYYEARENKKKNNIKFKKIKKPIILIFD